MAMQDYRGGGYRDASYSVIPLLRDIGESITMMKKMVAAIGSTADTVDERRKFLGLRTHINGRLQQATLTIQKLPSVRPEVESEMGVYVKQFRSLIQTATARYQQYKPYREPKISENAPLLSQGSHHPPRRKQKKQRRPKRDTSHQQWDDNNPFTIGTTEEEDAIVAAGDPLTAATHKQHKMKQSLMDNRYMNDVTVHRDTELLEEEHGKMTYIKEELTEMKEMFEEMDSLVSSQQSDVDHLESHALDIYDNVMSGNEQLLKGEKALKKARRNRCMLFVFLLIIVLALIAFIWTLNNTGKNNK